jgi:hypothetical protein
MTSIHDFTDDEINAEYARRWHLRQSAESAAHVGRCRNVVASLIAEGMQDIVCVHDLDPAPSKDAPKVWIYDTKVHGWECNRETLKDFLNNYRNKSIYPDGTIVLLYDGTRTGMLAGMIYKKGIIA